MSSDLKPGDRALSDRLWAKVERRGPDECWPFMGCLHYKGYGEIWTGGGSKDKAHRVAFVMAKGPIPEGMMVMHKCDSRSCCNPNHLSLGTNAENMADMVAKGRSKTCGKRMRGTNQPSSKLKDADVLEVMRLRGALTGKEVGARYGVAPSTIWNIWRGNRWSWLTKPDSEMRQMFRETEKTREAA